MSEPRLIVRLTGGWRCCEDDGDEGLDARWFMAAPVPFPAVASSASAGVKVPVRWYFTQFDLESSSDGRQVELTLAGAQGRVDAWLNGIQVLDAARLDLPVTRVVTAHLRAQGNLLAIRESAGARAMQPTATLSILPRNHIGWLQLQPDLRRKKLSVRFDSLPEGALHLRVDSGKLEAAVVSSLTVLDMGDLAPWSPESPLMHELAVELRSGEVLTDRVSIPFGVREFTIKDERFHLNQRPIHLRSVALDRVPDSAGDPAAEAGRLLDAVQSAGFNALEIPILRALPEVLDAAAARGLLMTLSADITAQDGQPGQELREELAGALSHVWNCPAVVMWQFTVHFGGTAPDLTAWAALFHAVDPSRVWILKARSGHATCGYVLRPYQDELRACDIYEIVQRIPVGALSEYYYRQCGAPGGFLYLNRLQCPGLSPDLWTPEAAPPAMFAAFLAGFEERQLDRLFGDTRGFAQLTCELQADALRFQLDALRANERSSGYCFHTLCDVPGCDTGIVNQQLAPKAAHAQAARVHARVRPLIYMQRKNLVPREEVSVVVLLANDVRLEGRAEISLQVVGPTNQVLWKKKRGVKIPKDGKEIWEGTIGASGSTGLHRFVVRIIQEALVIAEGSLEFLVLEQAAPTEIPVSVVDPRAEWTVACRKYARYEPSHTQVHVLPPLANTIRAYPEQEVLHLLAQVHGGAVAIVFSPPDDWNDLADRVDSVLRATSRDALGLEGAAFHYIKLHPVFEGLPARGLMRQPYRNVAPAKTLVEPSDEDICGAFVMVEDGWWGNDILVRRYGSGRIVFTHLRVLENLGFDPLANKLFVNLLNHFSRRSVPTDTPLPLNQKGLEWMKTERATRVRRWMIAGDFPNWRSSDGHDKVFPPEQGVSLDAEQVSWYRIVRWRPWFSIGGEEHRVDLHAALSQDHPGRAPEVPGTAYAYAEFSADRRQEAQVLVGTPNAYKVWLNGNLLGAESYEHRTHVSPLPGIVRQGRNTLLIKCSSLGGPFGCTVSLSATGREPLAIAWWK